MKRLVILTCVMLVVLILAFGASSALGGGINNQMCTDGTIPQSTGSVYNTLCSAWPGPQLPLP